MRNKKGHEPRVIFLDRDGVINKDPGNSDYVKKWSEFYFLPRAIEALRKLTIKGYEIIIISNQAGINKGLYTERDLDEITKKMLTEIEAAGGRIRGVYYCVHRDEDNCNCRKPKIGLFERAIKELRGPSSTVQTPIYFIGDGLADIKAGKNAGYKTILVLSGKSRDEEVENWQIKPDYIVKDLWEAVNLVVGNKQ
jgi:D-glycero-D-manno-heptose 1,7-bisphosphate phosphatase